MRAGLHAGELRAHLVDHGLVVGLAEDGRAGHEGVRARCRDFGDVVDLHAAVHFEVDLAAGAFVVGVDLRARLAQLVERLGNERLAAEARIHRHDQHEVDLVHHVVEIVQRRGRVEDEAGLAAVVADERQGAVDVVRAFRVEADEVRAGLGEVGHDAVDRAHHQMHVDGHVHVRADRLAHQRADGEVRHVMVVHHVEVDPVGAGGDDVADFFAKTREVGGQNTGGNSELRHGGKRKLDGKTVF
ncbi:hypothetical protein PT2222_210013 [Paraburkholderia tropica]